MHTVMEIIRLISRAAVTAERWLFTSPSACVSAVMRESGNRDTADCDCGEQRKYGKAYLVKPHYFRSEFARDEYFENKRDSACDYGYRGHGEERLEDSFHIIGY